MTPFVVLTPDAQTATLDPMTKPCWATVDLFREARGRDVHIKPTESRLFTSAELLVIRDVCRPIDRFLGVYHPDSVPTLLARGGSGKLPR